jgi:hypothetical protein
MAKPEPQSEHDWTIHALNIHGLFFEHWCQQTINSQQLWKVITTNYPVGVAEYHSALDIRAEAQLGMVKVVLLIECKKANPDFVNWIFFTKLDQPRCTAMHLPRMETRQGGPMTTPSIHTVPLHQPSLPFASDCRETRGDYQSYKKGADKTKTSNSAITDAANQIALATQSIFSEEAQWANDRISRNYQLPSLITLFVPVIVTSALLFVCGFSPQKVDPETGEIPYEGATLSPASEVVYSYPMPKYLHYIPPTQRSQVLETGSAEEFVRREIIVVHSSKFGSFLENRAVQMAIPVA